MPKILLNPRGYLSWTQVDMWRRSPDRYKRQYFEGEDGFTNRGMEYGSKTSAALENGDSEGDELLGAVISLLPRYKYREHELKATLETPHGNVVLLGKLDTYDDELPGFREYKTGKTKWTQAKAQKHGQMPHYGTLIYLTQKRLPSEAWLDWAETEYDYGSEVSFTGNIQSFRVELGMAEILEYMSSVALVAKEIDREYRAFMKQLT